MKLTYTHFSPFLLSAAVLISTSLLPVKLSAQCSGGNLATNYTSNNGSRGAMFNIVTGSSAITITSFDVDLYGGTTARYEIYYKSGTYIGSETNAANWTMAGGADNVSSSANNTPTPLPIPLSITIPANSTYGFYITNTASGGVNYTSSAVNNVTLATNSDLSLIGGVGKSYPFGSTYSYRLINCTVHYYKGSIDESTSLASSNTISPVLLQNSNSSTLYTNGCNGLISKVTGSGGSPASGNTTAKVWIDGTQKKQYVKRHYEITPTVNGSGRVTLYYNDQEFIDFNAQTPAPPILLPVSTDDPATITARKANLLIEKRSGVSSNGSGDPSTYSGSVQTIDPADNDIVWNASANRWEVSFDVTGFSGFWLKTSAFYLPLHLLNFTGTMTDNSSLLNWETAEEVNTQSFQIERSTDGANFTPVGNVAAQGSGSKKYSFSDRDIPAGPLYYRLKMSDIDQSASYSAIIRLNPGSVAGANMVSIYPNPIRNQAVITVNNRALLGTKAIIVDLQGKQHKSFVLQNEVEKIDLSQLNSGLYFLQLSNGTVQKLVKE